MLPKVIKKSIILLILYSFFVDISFGWGGNVRKSKLLFLIIFSICFLWSFSFAECQHVFNIVEEESTGKHHRECTICNYKDNSSSHGIKSEWDFDDEGMYHFYGCIVKDCGYQYNKGEHLGGNHNNSGTCSMCKAIYQTHELNAENVQYDNSYHWYTCSYNDCDYEYDKEFHEETEYVDGDLEYHWYRCKELDCKYKFNKGKHYGGSSNKGYCAFDLCEKLYVAKLVIDEYEYREYNVGDTDKLVASIIPEGIEVPEAEYKWSSSMPNVVSIDKTGNIEALREGISVIYCTYGKYVSRCVIVVGDLTLSVNPVIHNIYPNEIGTSEINVTYKKNKKDVNINEYVDFNAFKWEKNGIKADIKNVDENKVNFIGINESEISIIFHMWLDNRIHVLENKIEKTFVFDKILDKNENLEEVIELNKQELKNLKQEINKITENIDENKSNKKILNIKQKMLDIYEKINDDGVYKEDELEELKKLLIELWGSLLEYRREVIVNVLKIEQPEESSEPTDDPEETPIKTPEISEPPKTEGPIHTPEIGVSPSSGQNVVNRRHVCSYQNYFPNPKNPEKGHLKRCYYPSCEFYEKGIEGSESDHKYKYNSSKKVNMCIICYYEQGSGITEPEIQHSRDFGIDVLQSQYILVENKTTEVKVIITGVESDLKIYYGPVNGTIKSTEGRDDENSPKLTWDVKDEYLKEALDITFKKSEDDRIMEIKIKEGYTKSSRSEIDLILENNFGEKRIETIEVIKEAPERAQLIFRWSDITRSLKVGETKEIKCIVKNLYGYGMTDNEEIRKYYESKNLPKYEDIKIKWESTGGIKVISGDTTPDGEGYVRAQISGVSEGEGIVIAKISAKYENGDIIDIVDDRTEEQGIKVYKVTQETNNQSPSQSHSVSNPDASEEESSLPVAAGVMGGIAIILVVFVVNKMTQG